LGLNFNKMETKKIINPFNKLLEALAKEDNGTETIS
jgi:hypothetical protein